jgi:hypothetical protein
MPSLRDNLRHWRDSAQIDWFSQFIKAWIPFNAWMTESFGDLTDRELLDRVKSGTNVVYNRIVPILTWNAPQARGLEGGWQDSSQDAQAFREHVGNLSRLLQGCVVDGRRGRVSFETVDIGWNARKDEQLVKWKRTFRVRRDHPNNGEVTLELSGTASNEAFVLTQPLYDRRSLEDEASFQSLKIEQRSTFLALYDSISPRKVISVLASAGQADVLRCGTTEFVGDPAKVFSALVDVAYSLRNALFHGAITPNEQHNEIYEPAYHVVMRFVRCTI